MPAYLDPILLTIVSIVSTVIGILVGVFAIYFSSGSILSIFNRRKYKVLYGKYKMYNYARKDCETIVEWDMEITRRAFKTPLVRYKISSLSHGHNSSTGHLKIYQNCVFILSDNDIHPERGQELIIFKFPHLNYIDMELGILSCSLDGEEPYSGMHFICSSRWKSEDIEPLLLDRSHNFYLKSTASPK